MKKNYCFIRVGDAEVSGRNPRDCERLVAQVSKLAENQPVTIVQSGTTIKAGNMEQVTNSTKVTGVLSNQAPVSIRTPLGSVTGSSMVKIGACLLATELVYWGIKWTYKWVCNKYFKKDEPVSELPDLSDDDDVETQAEDEDEVDELRQPWTDWFHSNYKMPALPPFLNRLIENTPKGYDTPMLMHLTDAFAAICFSRVRARYLDGKVHSPNLAVVIEAPWGAGKEKFNTMLQTVFSRVIERDKAKLNMPHNETDRFIIQFCGIGITQTRFLDLLANNQGVHMYVFDSEVVSAGNAMKKSNGLTFEHLRKSFDNADITRMNADKNAAQGSFSLYLNYTLTGTPADIDMFIRRELQGGTPSRIIWCTIPENGRVLPTLILPEGDDLNSIQDMIDEWQKKYSYDHTPDGDLVVAEHMLDLDYVNAALKDWIEHTQWIAYENTQDVARKDARGRMAAIAFHTAMVYHVMFSSPGPNEPEKRKAVIDLTIYVANYCMESFLHKFGPMQRAQTRNLTDHDMVNINGDSVSDEQKDDFYNGLSRAEVKAMKDYYDASPDHGWKTTAKAFGYNGEAGMKKVKRAVEKMKKEEAAQ